MKSRSLLAISFVLSFILAGCAGEEAVKSKEDSSKGTPAETMPADGKGEAAGSGLSDQEKQKAQKMADLLAQHRIHFAFDSSSIDNESRAIIEAHAQNLKANPQIKVALEGNCDERGTREYNLALGERRAQAVEKLMKVLGVAANRVSTVSFGEEKGLCTEHNESCWRQNRRVEIVYK